MTEVAVTVLVRSPWPKMTRVDNGTVHVVAITCAAPGAVVAGAFAGGWRLAAGGGAPGQQHTSQEPEYTEFAVVVSRFRCDALL